MMSKYLLLSIMSLMVCACGIKPSNVAPPEGAETKQHPATYPKDISYDGDKS